MRKQHEPGDFVTAGHGEQPLTLKNPVPCLNGVTGAHWDGSFTRLNFSPELPAGLSVGMSVPLVWHRQKASTETFICLSQSHTEHVQPVVFLLIHSPSTPASWGEKIRASPQGEVLMYRWNWTFSFSLKPCLLSHLVKMDLWCSSSVLLEGGGGQSRLVILAKWKD